MKLISVYMTVKNGYPFIRESIESIKAQTYKNWELIVVDDGSTDETVEYLKSIENDDDRFNFIYTGGIGRAKALNVAVNHAKGDLIANLDADDMAHPKRLERQLAVFKDLKYKEVKFLCSKSTVVFDKSAPVWDDVLGDVNVEDVSKLLLIRNPVNHSSVMMNRSLFFEIGGYNNNLSCVIDYDLWCRLFASNNKIFMLSDTLVAKRIHKRQSFENKNRLNYLVSGYNIKKWLISQTGASKLYYIAAVAKLCYGFIPQKVRVFFG